MSIDNSLDGSENELNSRSLSSDEDWSELSSRPSNDRGYPTYQVGGIDGAGTLRLEESPDLDHDLIVVYEFVFEGDEEIVSNILDSEPDVHTIDLPYNQFDDREEAEDYMEFLMDYGVENTLDEYGVKSAKNREL